ncbi:MAG: hypothetical protein EA396_12630 [Anaerolineaceae bacterium]|nr:MAG: hypothetical protein EA396_12630 [Anaerolineaceae bacterium]
MKHSHPKPLIDLLSQTAAVVGVGAIALCVPALVGIVLRGAPHGFLLIIPVLCALGLPLLMQIVLAPAVTPTDDGLHIQPRFWPDRFVRWDDVRAVRLFPLLPAEDAEVVRRAAVGRRHYQAAQGIMLVIGGLGWPYRIAGVFAGAGGQPVIALTNRAHTDYDRLVQAILDHTSAEKHDLTAEAD